MVVDGTGSATAVPNIAKVSVAIQESASSLSEVEKSVNTKSKTLVDAVKKAGVEDKDIKTTSYNISPTYDYRTNPSRITGYSASVSYQVTIRNVDKANDVLAAATGAGANNVGGINFDVDDNAKNKALNEARAEAVKNARQTAEGLAKAAGVTLGKILNITESQGTAPVPLPMRGAGLGAGPSETKVQIQPGENEFNVTISITYEIR